MRRVNLLSSVALLVLAGALSACGGGGGGGGSGPGGGVVTPPVVPPVVPPPVTPPAAALLIATPFAAFSSTTSVNGAGVSTQQASVSLTDPDTASATRMRDLTIDGDETVTVGLNASLTANRTFVAANQTATNRTIAGRSLTLNEWRNGADSFVLLDGLLNDPHLSGPPVGGGTRLARFQIGAVTGFQVLGDRVVSRPTMGFAQYGGESYGEFVRADGVLFNFLGRADAKVDFAASRIQGQISSLNFADAAGAVATPGIGELGFSFAGEFNTPMGFSALVTSGQPGANGSVAGDFYDSASANGGQLGGVFNVNATAGRLTGGFVAGRTLAFNTFGAGRATYPSFARLLTSATTASSAFHRNKLDASGGANYERVEIAGNGTGRASQTIAVAVDDPSYTIARTFTPVDYQGPTGPTYLYWPSAATAATTDRPLQSVAWRGGLLAHPLYKRVNGAWTQATLAQAFEYMQSDVTPGVNSSLFMVSGPRSGNFTGSARFLGDAFGTYQGPFATPAVRVRGEMRIEVDFGRSQIRGALTDLYRSPTSGEVLNGPQLGLGEVAFSAPLSPSFAATATLDRANLTSLGGTVSGEFFGDLGAGSTEVGGVFALQSSQGALSGVYIAGRNPLPTGLASSILPQTFDGAGGTFLQSVGYATTQSLVWTRAGPGAGQSTATVAFTRDGVAGSQTGYSIVRDENSLRFNQTADVLIEIVERVSGRDLNYAGLARWRQGPTGLPTENFVAFGRRTTDMPTTGSAAYVGVGYGRYIVPGEDNLATGRFTLGANFGAGTVNGALENSQAKYALSFTGSIAADGYSGTYTTGDGVFSGEVKGFFAGPGAAETAGTFRSVGASSSRSYNGGFVAAK